jgi:hypothetical protein
MSTQRCRYNDRYNCPFYKRSKYKSCTTYREEYKNTWEERPYRANPPEPNKWKKVHRERSNIYKIRSKKPKPTRLSNREYQRREIKKEKERRLNDKSYNYYEPLNRVILIENMDLDLVEAELQRERELTEFLMNLGSATIEKENDHVPDLSPEATKAQMTPEEEEDTGIPTRQELTKDKSDQFAPKELLKKKEYTEYEIDQEEQNEKHKFSIVVRAGQKNQGKPREHQ